MGGAQVHFTPGESTASVTDGRGNTKTYTIGNGHPVQITDGGYNTGFQYNTNGLLLFAAYPEGNSVTYTYDSSNSQNRSKANLLSITENPGPRGSSDPAESTRTTTFTYETYCN